MPQQAARFPYEYERLRDSRDGDDIELVMSDRSRTRWGKWRWKQVVMYFPVGVVFFFGIIHLIEVSISLIHAFHDPPFPSTRSPLKNYLSGQTPELTDLTRDVTPIPCHSHNDYWRRIPLYEALKWGCTGVEADVWLYDNDLFVGHNTYSLTRERTFTSMYVDPLMRILERQNTLEKDVVGTETPAFKNGVFEVDPKQTLVLLVDFKNDGHAIYPFVQAQIAPFREKGYLTYFDGNTTIPGPLTVVATGNAPFDDIIADDSYRDIFFDAPLDRLYKEAPSNETPDANPPDAIRRSGQGTVGTSPTSHFDPTNSFYASVDFKKAVGWVFFGQLSHVQIERVRGQVRGAREAGLKARYWGTPSWPVGVRNKIWKVLVEEGVEYLNGDDLRGMTAVDWGVKRHWGIFG